MGRVTPWRAFPPPCPIPATLRPPFRSDYTNVSLASSAGLQYLTGYYVPFSKVNANGLETAVKEAERSGVKGLVLEMKDESGKLAWMSGVATASSNAANSTWDPTAYLSELKAQGWTITAEICCAVDTLLASANPDVALRDRTGAPYVDESGGWVDLWNRDVRTYIEELCTDLMAMGVDEIILSRVEHPFAEVMYTREIASSLNREAFCMNFSIAVREAIDKTMKDKNVHLSARVPRPAPTTASRWIISSRSTTGSSSRPRPTATTRRSSPKRRSTVRCASCRR